MQTYMTKGKVGGLEISCNFKFNFNFVDIPHNFLINFVALYNQVMKINNHCTGRQQDNENRRWIGT